MKAIRLLNVSLLSASILFPQAQVFAHSTPWPNELDQRVGTTRLTVDGQSHPATGAPCLVLEKTMMTSPARGFVPQLVIAIALQGGYVPIKQPVYPHPEGPAHGWFWDWGFSVEADRLVRTKRTGSVFVGESLEEGLACTGADGRFSGTGRTQKGLSFSRAQNEVKLVERLGCEGRVVQQIELVCAQLNAPLAY